MEGSANMVTVFSKAADTIWWQINEGKAMLIYAQRPHVFYDGNENVANLLPLWADGNIYWRSRVAPGNDFSQEAVA